MLFYQKKDTWQRSCLGSAIAKVQSAEDVLGHKQASYRASEFCWEARVKTKHVAILFVLSAAAGAPIVAHAQSANTPTLPARAPQATGPPKTDAAPAQNQVRPPVDAGSDHGITSSGPASGSSRAGPSIPMQAVPPVGDKPLPKPY